MTSVWGSRRRQPWYWHPVVRKPAQAALYVTACTLLAWGLWAAHDMQAERVARAQECNKSLASSGQSRGRDL